MQDDQHHETLRTLLASDEKVAEALFQGLLLHLAEECTECQIILHSFDPEGSLLLAGEPRSGVEQFEHDLRSADAVLRSTRTAVERQKSFLQEIAEASDLLDVLLDKPESERQRALENENRLHTRALAEALIEKARTVGYDHPAKARTLTALALQIVGRLDRTFYGREAIADLAARAWAAHGNALRVCDDLHAADQAFERAALMLRAGTGDPLARAQVLSLHSSLRKDQRLFDSADRLLEEAISTYLKVGEKHLAGRTLLKRALLLDVRDHPQEAMVLLEQSVELIDPKREPSLQFIVRNNLLNLWARFGQAPLAQRMLEQQAEFFARCKAPWQRRRLLWLEGLIARALGHPGQAEERFETLRAQFKDNGELYYWALVSLDLALVYADEGRAAELRELAEALFVTFQGLDIHREAFASLILFRQAAESDQANASIVHELITALKRHPVSPQETPS